MAAEVDKAVQGEQPPAPAPTAADAPALPPTISDENKPSGEKPAEQNASVVTTGPAEPEAEAVPVTATNGDKEQKVQVSVPTVSGALQETEPKSVASAEKSNEATTAPVPEAKKDTTTHVNNDAATEAEKPAEKIDTAPAPAPAAADTTTAVNGESSKDVDMKEATPATTDEVTTGDKRKADEPADTNGDVLEKKTKANTEATTNGRAAPKKVGRPRKEKREPAPPGRTARKTRSQGPVEA